MLVAQFVIPILVVIPLAFAQPNANGIGWGPSYLLTVSIFNSKRSFSFNPIHSTYSTDIRKKRYKSTPINNQIISTDCSIALCRHLWIIRHRRFHSDSNVSKTSEEPHAFGECKLFDQWRTTHTKIRNLRRKTRQWQYDKRFSYYFTLSFFSYPIHSSAFNRYSSLQWQMFLKFKQLP